MFINSLGPFCSIVTALLWMARAIYDDLLGKHAAFVTA